MMTDDFGKMHCKVMFTAYSSLDELSPRDVYSFIVTVSPFYDYDYGKIEIYKYFSKNAGRSVKMDFEVKKNEYDFNFSPDSDGMVSMAILDSTGNSEATQIHWSKPNLVNNENQRRYNALPIEEEIHVDGKTFFLDKRRLDSIVISNGCYLDE